MNEIPNEKIREIPWRLVGVAVVAAIIAVFIVQNWERTPVQFLFFDINSQLSLSLIVAILFGVVIDRLVIGLNRRRRRKD